MFGVTAFINFKIKDWVETNVRYALKSILDVNLLVLCRALETDTGRGGATPCTRHQYIIGLTQRQTANHTCRQFQVHPTCMSLDSGGGGVLQALGKDGNSTNPPQPESALHSIAAGHECVEDGLPTHAWTHTGPGIWSVDLCDLSLTYTSAPLNSGKPV